MENAKSKKQSTAPERDELVTAEELIAMLHLISSVTAVLCNKLIKAVEKRGKEDKERGFKI